MIDVSGESKVPTEGDFHNLLQTRLENGRLARLPGGHPIGVDVGDHHLHVGTVLGDHGHRGAADIARSDTKNPVDHDDLREGSRRQGSFILAGLAFLRLAESWPVATRPHLA